MPLLSRLRSRMNVSAACCLSIAFATSTGCQKAEFSPNELAAAGYLQTSDADEIIPVAEQIAQLTTELFGTPDEPKWPDSVEQFLDWEEVLRSAGPVGRAHDQVERGLYRKHCVQCHGLSGDGGGPAAMVLAPYARDFRRGTFKFKSTPLGSKPTRQDLIRIIENGIPGTSMPAFAPLRNREEFAHDIESVTEYVIFLSIRGEVERLLIREQALSGELPSREDALAAVKNVVQAWQKAESEVPPEIPVPELHGDELTESIQRGQQLFVSNKAACFKCHGETGSGDGISQDFDEWTKDWTIRVGIDPLHKSDWKVMKAFGARKPVLNQSRNLHLGGLRGGAELRDVARRIQVGIDGTPMPSATVALDPNVTDPPVGLSMSEFQDLVRFVCFTAGVSMSPKALQTEPNPSTESPRNTLEQNTTTLPASSTPPESSRETSEVAP